MNPAGPNQPMVVVERVPPPAASSSSAPPADAPEPLAAAVADDEINLLLLPYYYSNGIGTELQLLQEVQESIRTAWEAECELYGQTMELTLLPSRRPETVARRNYFHPSQTVQDPRLFPYHNGCYLLIDAYDCLYYHQPSENRIQEEEQPQQGCWIQPVPPGVVRLQYEYKVVESPLQQKVWDTDAGLRLPPEVLLRQEDDEIFDSTVPEYMPCSPGAIEVCLLGREKLLDTASCAKVEPGVMPRLKIWPDPDFWDELVQQMNALDIVHRSTLDEEEDTSPTIRCRDDADLPSNPTERTDLLLKLLQHSLSDLQRDFKLAAACIYALMKHRDLDTISVFRRVLVILDAECRHYHCEFPCEENDEDHHNNNNGRHRPKHHCRELQYFLGMVVQKIFIVGIAHLTPAHAVCVAAWIRAGFLRDFGSLLLLEEHSNTTTTKTTSVEGKRQHWLKRAIGVRRAELEDDTVGQQIPVDLFGHVVVGLGERARRERHYHIPQQRGADPEEDKAVMRRRIDTYNNCVRTLVHVAYSTIQILPENERFYGLAGMLLFGMVQSYATENLRRWDGGFYYYSQFSECDYYLHNKNPLGNALGPEDGIILDWRLTNPYFSEEQEPPQPLQLSPKSLINPFRYAATIGNATPNHQLNQLLEVTPYRSSIVSSAEQLRQHFLARFVTQPPPELVRNAIRGLFLKNLIDVRGVGFGYGDCLLLCRMDVSALDPMLFWHTYAYTEEEEESSDDDDDEDEVNEDDEPADWEIDETRRSLTKGELRARYDLSLLLLVRAWQAPWTPESHASFSPEFRRAVQTVALCTYRLQYPQDFIAHVASFLPRDAWPDPRQQCWSNDCCLLDSLNKASRMITGDNKVVTTSSATAASSGALLKYCERCKFAPFCANKDCYENEFKLGHKRICCRPPFLSTPPDDEELQFCVELFKSSTELIPPVLTRIVTAIEKAANPARDGNQPDRPPFPMEEGAAATPMQVDGGDDDNNSDWEDMKEELGNENANNDDDGSWETVDSNDNHTDDGTVAPSPTSLIYKYFKRNTYDHVSRGMF